MNTISLEGSRKTPMIHFDADEGLIEMRGRSIPENTVEFFTPLLNWIDEYGKNPKPVSKVEVKLEYFNTSSAKFILDVFLRLEGIHKNGNTEIKINWYYDEDDEDMFEVGQEYNSMLTLPFEIIPVPVEEDEDDDIV